MIKQTLFSIYCSVQRQFNLNWLPPVIHWELTFRCNQRCTFCPYYGTDSKKPNFKKELSLEQIDRILANINKSYKFYKPHFGLTGGDIFVRKDIKEVLQLFRKYNLSYSVTTNGLGLNEDLLELLKNTGCTELRFSLHGLMKTHDALTRVPNSWRKTRDMLIAAKQHLPVMVNCVITDNNISELAALFRSMRSINVPIRFQHLEWITEKEQISQEQHSMTQFKEHLPMKFGTTNISDKNIEPIYEFLYEYNPEQEPRKLNDRSEFNIIRYYRAQAPFRKHCISIFGTARIDPYGNVYPCVDYYYGNLLESSFKEIWFGEKAKIFKSAIRKSLMPGCARCCKL